MLDQEVQANVASVQALVDDVLNKPLFMQGMADANAELGILPSSILLDDHRFFSLALGGYASATSDSLDPNILRGRLDSIQAEDDYPMGAALHPLSFQLKLPLDKLVKGLGIQASFGHMSLSYEGFDYSGWMAGGGLNWRCFGPSGKSRLLRWEGLELSLALAYSENKVGTEASTGAITRNFSIDLGEDNPLFFGYPVSISLDPSFDIAVKSSSFALPFQFATGISALGFLTLQFGAGLYPAWGQSRIDLKSVDGTTGITIGGQLAQLIAEGGEGSIKVSGSTAPTKSRSLGAFLSATARLDFGHCGISLPLLWDFRSGYSAGLSMVVSI